MLSATCHGLQRQRLRQVQHIACAVDKTHLAQMTKYAREGFRGDAQLRRNQALALVQCDAHGA